MQTMMCEEALKKSLKSFTELMSHADDLSFFENSV